MIRRTPRGRSGITLTEILISIMIMGVGMVSLATLFPLGLLRLHRAQRLTRSAFLKESAGSDLAARDLLNVTSFNNGTVTPWYTAPTGLTSVPVSRYDPWVQDTPSGGNPFIDGGGVIQGAYRGRGAYLNHSLALSSPARPGPGLPVAYDPLWRAVTEIYPSVGGVPTPVPLEARFGAGLNLRNNPNGGLASAHGLQRVTNLAASANGALTPIGAGQYPLPLQQMLNYRTAIDAFVSPEDVVWQESTGQYLDPTTGGPSTGRPSTIVPDLSQGTGANLLTRVATGGSPAQLYPSVNDWRFSWMFTGARVDAVGGEIYEGDVVIFENRQFGADLTGGTGPTGETVVEAVFGYGTNVLPVNGSGEGYARGARRNVVLLWPSTLPDPEVKAGQWIADVTYERDDQVAQARYNLRNAYYPAQRCHWYQIVKRTEPSVATVPFAPAGYRQMTVWVHTDLMAQSMLTSAGLPINVEAALIAPGVVNVYHRTIVSGTVSH